MAVPGDVEISQCIINSPRGSLDLNHLYTSARVYESTLVENNIVEIDVFDTDDALGNLSLLGDETINFSFCAPGTPVLDYVFALDKVELADTDNPKSKQYIVHGVGKEAMYAKTNFVKKSYKTDISSIVTDIHKTFLKSAHAIITEVTDGIQQLVIPNMRPFDAIDMVRRRAVSSVNPSSTFLYFENADGHNFKTIEGMMKQGPVKVFVHGDAVGSSIYNNTTNNIINYQVPKIISSTERIALGGMSQRVATFDIRTRKFSFKDVKPTQSGWNSSAFQAAYGAVFGLFHLLPTTSVTNNTNIPTSTPEQMGYLSNLLQCNIVIYVNGDTTVKAGDTITINIPQSITTTGITANDPTISNNYLVSRLCRNIDKIEVTPRYTETIEGIVAAPLNNEMLGVRG